MLGGPRGAAFLMEQEASKPKKTSETLRRFGVYFRPFWPALLLALVLVFVSTWTQVTGPQLLGQAVDCYLSPSQSAGGLAALSGASSQSATSTSNCTYDPSASPTMSTEAKLAGLGGIVLRLIGLYVLGSVTVGLTFYSMTWAGQHVLKSMRIAVFKHLHRLSLGYYAENESGNLMSRITNDSDTIQQAINFALVNVVSGVLLLVWIAYNMLTANWFFALISLATAPFMWFATRWFSGQARKAFRKTRSAIGDVNAELQQSIAGVREVQAFSREQENIDNFRDVNAANRDANIRAVAYTSALAPTLEALGYAGLALVATVGGALVLQGTPLFGSTVSLGLVITFIAYVQRFNQPIQQIAVLWTNIQSAIAGGERIFGLLDVVPDVQDKPAAQPMPQIQGTVEFAQTHAEYEKDVPVLRGVSFKAEPGQMIALVGPTGAGKTTIINLLPRFYDVTAGSVKVDGIDVRDAQAATLRQQIGIVLQDSFLFSDTVMNNIRFGRPQATDEEVIAAAKLARADTFIERLPEGYETVLGERGSGLSQGQRQLISIARAALANPRILILDEATSSVDTRTERLIQAALEQLLHGRTSFVVAHRLSTIKHADQILVINDGEIIERGKFNELLDQKGFFYDLYMSQFRRQEPVSTSMNGNGQKDRGNGQKADGGMRVATATA
ncbi:MAG TPA: ABC transporter ATP-binding protein [Anaerolineae bacterium]|nr:ABC transporter ATP-binding protein [Anaerolineae bacterium]